MSVNFLATSVPSEPDNFAGIYGIYPIDRTSVGVLVITIFTFTKERAACLVTILMISILNTALWR